MVFEEGSNRVLEFAGAAVKAAAQLPFSKQREPAFDQVKPGTAAAEMHPCLGTPGSLPLPQMWNKWGAEYLLDLGVGFPTRPVALASSTWLTVAIFPSSIGITSVQLADPSTCGTITHCRNWNSVTLSLRRYPLHA